VVGKMPDTVLAASRIKPGTTDSWWVETFVYYLTGLIDLSRS
jgi:hypothetical protein